MDLINELLATQHPVVPGVLLAMLIGLALYLSWSPIQQLLSHWRLQSLVSKLGIASLRNVYIPDGLGDVIYVEQLILRPAELLLITIKPFRGNIFAAFKGWLTFYAVLQATWRPVKVWKYGSPGHNQYQFL